MWSSTSRSEAAERLAPILEKETEKTWNNEWLRYRARLEQINPTKIGFVLTDEQEAEMKANMSPRISSQVNYNSFCMINALDLTTYKSSYVSVLGNSEGRLVLGMTSCPGCEEAGKTIYFDFKNSFWKDNEHNACDTIYYATS